MGAEAGLMDVIRETAERYRVAEREWRRNPSWFWPGEEPPNALVLKAAHAEFWAAQAAFVAEMKRDWEPLVGVEFVMKESSDGPDDPVADR